jgi:hypothetical protein
MMKRVVTNCRLLLILTNNVKRELISMIFGRYEHKKFDSSFIRNVEIVICY